MKLLTKEIELVTLVRKKDFSYTIEGSQATPSEPTEFIAVPLVLYHVPIVLFGDPMNQYRTYLDLGGFTYLVDKNIDLLKGLIEEAK